MTTKLPSKVLDSSEKFNKLKPVITQITARITQCGEAEFYDHLSFLENYLKKLSNNSYHHLYEQLEYKTAFNEREPESTGPDFVDDSDIPADDMEPLQLDVTNDLAKPLKFEPSFKLTPVRNPAGRPKGTHSTITKALFPSKTPSQKKRKLNNVSESAPSTDSVSSGSVKFEKVECASPSFKSTLFDCGDLQLTLKNEWLDYIHINYFLKLLRERFPDQNGLCGTDILSLRSYDTSKLGNSIFIDNPCGNHWVTISNIGCEPGEWAIYDSLSYDCESSITFFQYICPFSDSVSVLKPFAQRQTGSNDCGLFALAFAFALCDKQNPSALCFFQKGFRKHFNSCVQAKEASAFPSQEKMKLPTRKEVRRTTLQLK